MQSQMTQLVCNLLHQSIGFFSLDMSQGLRTTLQSVFVSNLSIDHMVQLLSCISMNQKRLRGRWHSLEQHHVHTIDHKRAAQRRSQSTLIVPGGWLQYKSVALFYTESSQQCHNDPFPQLFLSTVSYISTYQADHLVVCIALQCIQILIC